jgi:hypothetical protein
MNKNKIIVAVLGAGLLVGSAAPALALGIGADVHANLQASTSGAKAGLRGDVKANIQATRIENAKKHADEELVRRTSALTELNTRIQSMTKVSASVKTTLTSTISSQITALTNLQTKIDADTATDTLKADIKSITDSYRIFMLIMPQVRIAAAVDVIGTVGDSMTAMGAKLQTRITAAQSAGKDVTALTSLLSDMTAKIADANVQANAALTETASLTPDNGDIAKMDANNVALKDARAKLKASGADMKTARQDIQKILQGLKAFHLDASASTTVSGSH